MQCCQPHAPILPWLRASTRVGGVIWCSHMTPKIPIGYKELGGHVVSSYSCMHAFYIMQLPIIDIFKTHFYTIPVIYTVLILIVRNGENRDKKLPIWDKIQDLCLKHWDRRIKYILLHKCLNSCVEISSDRGENEVWKSTF